MIANVILKNRIFQSPVFAIFYGKHWDSEFVILNENDNFEIVKEYREGTDELIPQIMIVDLHKYDNGDWLKEKNCEGYKEFIHNPKLIDKIKRGEKNVFDWLTMELYISMHSASGYDVDYGPIFIKDENAIENLIAFAGGFHDAVIEEIIWEDEKKKNLTVTLNGVWGLKKMYLHFKNVSSMNIEDEYQWNYFFAASIFFENNKICFVDDEDITTVAGHEKYTYFVASSLSYSYEIGESTAIRSGPFKVEES